jgi:hypothetical protein
MATTDKNMSSLCTQPVSDRKPLGSRRRSVFHRLRKNIGAALEYTWEASASVRHLQVDVMIIEGAEKFSGDGIRTLYIGHHENDAFMLNRIYEKYEVTKKHAKLPVTGFFKYFSLYRHSVDLIILDLELLLSRSCQSPSWLVIPQWIRQKYYVPDTWEEVLSKFRKNTKKTDLRKVRKYRFSYRITRDINDFDIFYEKLYRPYLEMRFNDEVIIEPKSKVLRQCRKGELMQIIREGEVVAAVLLHKSEGRLAYVWVGVPDHIVGEMSKGAFSALYYFTILYGFNTGCHEIDFLGTRPLLNDGLFQYKRKWGTVVQRSPIPRGDILLKPVRSTNAVISFLNHNIFVVREGKNLIGKIFHSEGMLDQQVLAGMVSKYATAGLSALKIFCLMGYRNGTIEWACSQDINIDLIDLKNIQDPVKSYCIL